MIRDPESGAFMCGPVPPSDADLAIVRAYARWLAGDATVDDLALLDLPALPSRPA